MSSTSFRASADSASASNEPGCEPSPSVRSNLSPVPSSPSIGRTSPAITTSMTLQQTDWIGMESVESTSSAAATLASPFPTPGSKEATKIRVTSGRKCAELLAKSDPLGYLLKMLLVTSRWGSTRCLLTWKPMATQRGRLLFRLVPKTPPTSGSESGSWLATATATANQTCPSMQKWKGCRAWWPTPHGMSGAEAGKKYDGHGNELSQAVLVAEGLSTSQRSLKRVPREMWPTPSARDWKDTPGMKARRRDGRDRSADQLPRAVYQEEAARFYPTMDYGAAKGRGQSSADDRSRLGGSLNPEWVEWLMGFPDGWTDLGHSEPQSSPKLSKKSGEQSLPPTTADEAGAVK